jgi:uncharacterized repeat protein (TIGR03803 family)
VVIGAKGNVYGTTETGGANFAGAVFELTPNANGPWTETVMHPFAFNGTDGALPYSGLIVDVSGDLYGTTLSGGANGEGTVFVLTPRQWLP